MFKSHSSRLGQSFQAQYGQGKDGVAKLRNQAPIQALMSHESFLHLWMRPGEATGDVEKIQEIADNIVSLLRRYNALPPDEAPDKQPVAYQRKYAILQNIDYFVYKWARLSKIPAYKAGYFPNLELMTGLLDEVNREKRSLFARNKEYVSKVTPLEILLHAVPFTSKPHEIRTANLDVKHLVGDLVEKSTISSALSPHQTTAPTEGATPATTLGVNSQNFEEIATAVIMQLLHLPTGKKYLEDLIGFQQTNRRQAINTTPLVSIEGIIPEESDNGPWIDINSSSNRGVEQNIAQIDANLSSGDYMVNTPGVADKKKGTSMVTLFPSILYHIIPLLVVLARKHGTPEDDVPKYVLHLENVLRHEMGLPERSDMRYVKRTREPGADEYVDINPDGATVKEGKLDTILKRD